MRAVTYFKTETTGPTGTPKCVVIIFSGQLLLVQMQYSVSFFKLGGARFGIHLEPVVTVQRVQSSQVYVPAVDQYLH